jgi:hypothetical protein
MGGNVSVLSQKFFEIFDEKSNSEMTKKLDDFLNLKLRKFDLSEVIKCEDFRERIEK